MRFLLVFLVLFEFCFVYSLQQASQPKLQIVNGEEARNDSIPYQAYIKFFDNNTISWICGGSLISKSYVLTSAMCTYGAQNATVVLGAVNISINTEPTRQTFNTSKFIVHPEFDEDIYFNDIALIKIEEATLNDDVNIIQLPLANDENKNLTSKSVFISGWGRRDSFENFSEVLRVANVSIINIRTCEEIYYDLVRRERQVCTRDVNSGKITSCEGDFGGPVVFNGTLYGVQSFASPMRFCQAGYPAVSSKVSYYLDWIEDNINSSGLRPGLFNSLLIGLIFMKLSGAPWSLSGL